MSQYSVFSNGHIKVIWNMKSHFHNLTLKSPELLIRGCFVPVLSCSLLFSYTILLVILLIRKF